MVISQFYPLLGGAELQAQRLAKALRKKGAEVFVVTRRLKGLSPQEIVDTVPVHRAIKSVPLPWLWGICFMVSVFFILYRRRREYTIIHCHILQEFQTVIAVLFKYLLRKKVIVKMSSSGLTSDIKLLRRSPWGRIFWGWIKKVDAVVSVCSQSSRELLSEGFPGARIVEIPNGVDLSTFVPHPSRPAREVRTITFVGRLDAYKGVAVLLEAFKGVLSQLTNLRLLIVGTGPDATLLKETAGAMELEGRVHFRGREEDVLSVLGDTDIFVLPTLSEGMSNVLLEAMACGLPVVATAVGGNSDLISHRCNGMLVPPADPQALREALVELLENTTLAQHLGGRARKTVEDHYSMERVTERYLQLYAGLASRKRWEETGVPATGETGVR